MPVRKYELMVILDPARSEEQQTESLNKIDEIIAKYGGTPEKRDIIGKRRLAYSISKRREGYYAVVTFDGISTGELLSEVERYCKYSEEILRHIVTLAVVGKSKGDPALAEQALARQQAQQSYGRGPGGRGGRRYDDRPAAAPTEAPVEAAPVEAAPTE